MIYYFLVLICLFQVTNSLYLPCVDYNNNCYDRTCCEPYVCYEQTICIGMNNTTI